MKNLLLIIAVFTFANIFAQNNEPPKFGISFSGFVKTDFFYDSRQNVTIREGHFLLYPENAKLDINGMDINDKDMFGILAIQSRLTGKITGPDFLKAKTSGMIEADFFGNESAGLADVNGFRLRHAYLKLSWAKTELLMGQYWHPLFAETNFADVISFNTGAPFQPFSRNPQIRFSKNFGKLKLMLAAAEQRDFTSLGPDGGSSKYLRNSVMPDMNAQLSYSTKFKETNEFQFGLGVEYKWLTPYLSVKTDLNNIDGIDTNYYVGNQKVESFAFNAFTKLKIKKLTFKAYGIYGGNLTDQVMLGGYAVKSITYNPEPVYEYLATKVISAWADFSYSAKFSPGIFVGYTQNLGTGEANLGTYYSRGSNIHHVMRVAPRVIYNMDKVRLAAELEYTTAQYGKADSTGVVNTSLTDVANIRFIVGAYYFF